MEDMSELVDPVAEAERLGAMVNGKPDNVSAALPRLLELLHGTTNAAVLVAVLVRRGTNRRALRRCRSQRIHTRMCGSRLRVLHRAASIPPTPRRPSPLP